jgi:hypothetical protein
MSDESIEVVKSEILERLNLKYRARKDAGHAVVRSMGELHPTKPKRPPELDLAPGK